jgi:hypothetical protein
VRRHADISEDGRYRWWLTRAWAPGPSMAFVMLNPSTADAERDDPTIKRCVGFAERERCGSLIVVNLFALRATRPADLLEADDPVGPHNTRVLIDVLAGAHKHVVGAWGSHPAVTKLPHPDPVALGLELGRSISHLGLTQTGQPRHPLYLPATAPLRPMPLPGAEPLEA